MPFTPPAHTLYPWQDGRGLAMDAQHLGAAEQGGVDHTNASVVALSDGLEAEISALGVVDQVLNIISGVGSLSGTYQLDMSAANLTLAGVATMVGNVIVTPINFSAGSRAEVSFSDGGGFALSVLANGQTVPVTIPASGPFILRLGAMDGSVFCQAAPAALAAGSPVSMWSGSIAALDTGGQLDAAVWPYQSVAAGHLTVLADPLGTQGTVLTLAITETG